MNNIHKNTSYKRQAIAVGATVSALFCTFGLSSVAFAATNNTLQAKRAVYLRSEAHLGHDTIVRESAGTQFTIEPGSTLHWWHVTDEQGNEGYVIRNSYWVAEVANPATSASTSSTSSFNSGYSAQGALPPGVKMDASIQPLASRNATPEQKFQAILSVAQSKLGTPYIWGHNEDRGQYGFDCSNFTEYVYHHALGYKFSGASRVQASSVGWTVSKQDMQLGDLLIFNDGSHVGIYIGNNEMIEEGGGLGKVGYLSVRPGSYWGDHITAVKRMF